MEYLVLRRIEFEESSVIINVLSKESFKSFIVKGAKKKNSNKLSLCEPITIINPILGRPSKMETLIEGSVVNDYFLLKNDIVSLSIASVLIEYAYQFRESSIDTSKLYDIITLSLDNLIKGDDKEIILFKFEILLANLLGISLNKCHLIEKYKLDENTINALEAIMKSEKVNERTKVRKFFIDYFDQEMDIKIKSKKLYITVIE